jgi:glycine/D-amino acid oxidase-like deaminating enzyme
MRARIVIIGTDITGLCLALELARRTNPLREPVLLISGGELESAELELCCHNLEDKETALEARHGLRFWSGLWAATGRDPGWNSCGLVYEKGFEEHPTVWKRLLELGASVRREPGELFDEDAGTLSTAKAATCLEALAREAGAVVRIHEVAEELVIEAGKITGVKTSRGSISTSEVLLAGTGGATFAPGGPPVLNEKRWTEFGYEANEPLAVEATSRARDPKDLFATNEQGREAAAGAFEAHFERDEPVSSEVMALVSGDLVASPEPEGRLWVRGAKQAEAERGALAERVLGCARVAAQRTHSSWMADDESPVIGPVPSVEGAWIACGFGEDVSLFAPACAEGLAERILKGESGWFSGKSCDPRRASLSWSNRAR